MVSYPFPPKGKLLFNSVELVNFGVGRWLFSSRKMHHIFAHWRFEGIFEFICAGFPKKYVPLSLFYTIVLFLKVKTLYFGGVLGLRNQPNHVIPILVNKRNIVLTIHWIFAFGKFELLRSSENSFKNHCIQKWHIAVKHLNSGILTTFVPNGTFWEICRMKIQICTQTSIEPK